MIYQTNSSDLLKYYHCPYDLTERPPLPPPQKGGGVVSLESRISSANGLSILYDGLYWVCFIWIRETVEFSTKLFFTHCSGRPVRVNNGSCLVYNWQNMTCVWDLEVIYLHANTRDINITVSLNHNDSLNFNHLDYDVTLHWSVWVSSFDHPMVWYQVLQAIKECIAE